MDARVRDIVGVLVIFLVLEGTAQLLAIFGRVMLAVYLSLPTAITGLILLPLD